MNYKFVLSSGNNKKGIIILLSMLVLGFILRVYHLGNLSLWFDELCTARRSVFSPSAIINNAAFSSFPPLYYLMMNLWIKAFGSSEFALRFPSLIFSCLSLIFVFIVAKELFNERVGLYSALLLSVSPYSINYAQEAKMYSLLWLLGILSFLYFYRFTQCGSVKNLVLYSIFAILSIYTMYIGFIFIITQNLLFFAFFNPKLKKKWLLGQLLIVVAFLPWADKFYFSALHRTGVDWIPKITDYLKYMQDFFLLITGIAFQEPGTKRYFIKAELLLYLALLISAFLHIKSETAKKYRFRFGVNDWVVFAWIIVPLIIYLLIENLCYPMLVYRYMGFILIPLTIFFAKGLSKLGTKMKPTILILLMFFIFSLHLIPYFKYNQKIDNEDWRELYSQIEKRPKENSLIICFPNGAWIMGYYCKNTKIVDYPEAPGPEVLREKYASIFVIYRERNEPGIRGNPYFHLEERYSLGTIGFRWYKSGIS
ncbi:MAG: glycosyltransferase family 39 protein [Candidatus Omnitrophica bacterium]|nr:glycosyltransferase family 39 protein [Candidatus Omnitrophota bacterium]